MAESQGEAVGTVIGFIPYLPPSLLLEMRIEYIGHLALHPDLQGRGIGSSS
ncbi:GNAT family N-acetyltransferase [Candidatus Bathyarchaeota archaeon]|nr:GNAT family N-acetyltransferase [Candidatus Bathyarchaeota archaeon]